MPIQKKNTTTVITTQVPLEELASTFKIDLDTIFSVNYDRTSNMLTIRHNKSEQEQPISKAAA